MGVRGAGLGKRKKLQDIGFQRFSGVRCFLSRFIACFDLPKIKKVKTLRGDCPQLQTLERIKNALNVFVTELFSAEANEEFTALIQ